MARPPAPPPPAGAAAGETYLHVNLWRSLRRHKLLIALTGLLGLAAGAAATKYLGVQYESNAQILVLKKKLESAPISGPLPAQPQYEDYLSTHQIVITSPRVIEAAVAKSGLGALSSLQGQPNVVGAIQKGMSVDRVFKIKGGSPPTNILNLAFDAPDPDDARTVLDAVLASYQAFLGKTYHDSSGEVLDLIARARDILQNDLRAKEAALLEFRQSTLPLGTTKDGHDVQTERLFSIDQKRSTLRMRQAELRSALAALKAAPKAGVSLVALLDNLPGLTTTQQVVGTGFLSPREAWQGGRSLRTSLDEELVNLQLQEAKLLENFGPGHREVKAVRQRIDAVRGLMAPANGRSGPDAPPIDLPKYVDMKMHLMEEELRENQRTSRSLDELFQREKAEAKQAAVDRTRDEILSKDVAQSQLLFDSILKRLQEVDSVKDYGGFNMQVLAPPQRGQVAWLRLLLLMGVPTFLGLLLGYGSAFTLDMTERKFRTPGEVSERLGVPVLGHVPAVAGAGERGKPAAAGQPPDLCVVCRPAAPESDAVRAVRAALLANLPEAGHPVVLLTSPDRRDGAAALAANVAAAVALSGKRVLLVDADLRRPHAHETFGVANDEGLTAALAGRADPAQVVRPTAVPGLSLVPAGAPRPDAAELLASARLPDFLASVRGRFDLVVLDAPDLLGAADASALAPHADGVVLAVRVARKGRPRAESAKAVLDTVGARVVGVVVNAPPGRRGAATAYPDGEEY